MKDKRRSINSISMVRRMQKLLFFAAGALAILALIVAMVSGALDSVINESAPSSAARGSSPMADAIFLWAIISAAAGIVMLLIESRLRSKSVDTCPSCHKVVKVSDRFCRACGVSLSTQ